MLHGDYPEARVLDGVQTLPFEVDRDGAEGADISDQLGRQKGSGWWHRRRLQELRRAVGGEELDKVKARFSQGGVRHHQREARVGAGDVGVEVLASRSCGGPGQWDGAFTGKRAA